MAARKRKTTQDPPLKGGKKKTDNSTSYNKGQVYHKQSTPGYPYGSPHLKSNSVKKGTSKK